MKIVKNPNIDLFNQISIDFVKFIKDIQYKFNSNNFEFYMVGGSIRDSILGKKPKDFDFATNATPEQMKSIFGDNILKDFGGEKFGTLSIPYNNKNYEITTYRKDSAYRDSRHPENVSFNASMIDDAQRRDFTINALYYDILNDTLYIPIESSLYDLNNKLIKTVGDPDDRFSEDALRIMRAIRFSSKYSFSIEPNTLSSMYNNAGLVRGLSIERIFNEFHSMLINKNPSVSLKLLYTTDILEYFFKELKELKGCKQREDYHPEGDVWNHTMIMIDKYQSNFRSGSILPFAVLFHDIGKPNTQVIKENGIISNPGHEFVGAKMTKSIMRLWNTSNDKINDIAWLVENHMLMHKNWGDDAPPNKRLKPSTKKKICRHHRFTELLDLGILDEWGRLGTDISNVESAAKYFESLSAEDIWQKPFVDGSYLNHLGVDQGPIYKELLNKCFDKQLDGILKTKSEAETYIKHCLKSRGYSLKK